MQELSQQEDSQRGVGHVKSLEPDAGEPHEGSPVYTREIRGVGGIGVRGRKPKPVALRNLGGNAGKRPVGGGG